MPILDAGTAHSPKGRIGEHSFPILRVDAQRARVQKLQQARHRKLWADGLPKVRDMKKSQAEANYREGNRQRSGG